MKKTYLLVILISVIILAAIAMVYEGISNDPSIPFVIVMFVVMLVSTLASLKIMEKVGFERKRNGLS